MPGLERRASVVRAMSFRSLGVPPRTTREPVAVDLSGVSATLLSNLARRAAAARAKRPLLDDPLAVEAVARLDYDFTDFSRGASWHALRVATFDGAVRRF